MTRVLLISPTGVPGGAGRALATLAGQLPSRGFEPQAVVLQEARPCGSPPQAAVLGSLPRRSAPPRRASIVVSGFVLRCVAKVGPPMMVRNESKGHFYGGLAALGARLPATWWRRESPALIESSALPGSCRVLQLCAVARLRLCRRRSSRRGGGSKKSILASMWMTSLRAGAQECRSAASWVGMDLLSESWVVSSRGKARTSFSARLR